MAERIVTPSLLRQMMLERIEAHARGEISAEFLKGYAIAMFHAGAITVEECSRFEKGERGEFALEPPPAGNSQSTEHGAALVSAPIHDLAFFLAQRHLGLISESEYLDLTAHANSAAGGTTE